MLLTISCTCSVVPDSMRACRKRGSLRWGGGVPKEPAGAEKMLHLAPLHQILPLILSPSICFLRVCVCVFCACVCFVRVCVCLAMCAVDIAACRGAWELEISMGPLSSSKRDQQGRTRAITGSRILSLQKKGHVFSRTQSTGMLALPPPVV